MASETPSKVKKVLLAIAIAIILAFFMGYGVTTLYKEPADCSRYDYEPKPDRIETNFTLCEDIYDQNRLNEEACRKDGGDPRYSWDDNGCRIYERCEMCFADYEKTVFFIYVILGIIAVILGAIVLKVPSVSSGIMSGGILILIYCTIRYWGVLQEFLRVGILGIVLAILVWIGYKKLQ